MRALIALAVALLAGPVLADCPQPIPEDLGEAVAAAKAQTRRFRYKKTRLEPKLRELTAQELAHYVTDLADGFSPSGYDKAMALAFEVAADKSSSDLLKYALDGDGDGYSVVRILAHDVDDQDLVRGVLGTFAPAAGSSALGIKLLSDVDDTIYANLVDPRYEKTESRYPGVEALYRAIAEESGGVDARFGGGLTLVTLSARPEIRDFDAVKPSLEDVSEKLGRICAMSLGGEIVSSSLGTLFTFTAQTLPSVRKFKKRLGLYEKAGSEKDLSPEDVSFLARQENRIGQVKFDNFRRFALVYPSYDYVFFGDSGQADAHAARLIMEHNGSLNGPGKAIITFIHDLRVDGEAGDGRGLSPTRAVCDAVEREDVVLFRNHVQAALIAYRRGRAGEIRELVDAQELVAVVEQALAELPSARFKTPEIGLTVRAGFALDAAEAIVEAQAAGAENLTGDVFDLVTHACGESGAGCSAFR